LTEVSPEHVARCHLLPTPPGVSEIAQDKAHRFDIWDPQPNATCGPPSWVNSAKSAISLFQTSPGRAGGPPRPRLKKGSCSSLVRTRAALVPAGPGLLSYCPYETPVASLGTHFRRLLAHRWRPTGLPIDRRRSRADSVQRQVGCCYSERVQRSPGEVFPVLRILQPS